MEGAVLYVLKSACSCLASQATSSAAKEMELQEAMDKNAFFLAEELEEMDKFLLDVDRNNEAAVGSVEQGADLSEAQRSVEKIRDMACDIEDCLRDLDRHRERSSIRRWASMASRHSIAAELELWVSRVNNLNPRRERYRRRGGRAGRMKKPMLRPADEEARPVPESLSLGRLIASAQENRPLAVISLWLMKHPGSASAAISLVGEVYDGAKEFQRRAWVTATHPISLTEFLRALARQLLLNDPAQAALQGQGELSSGVLGDTETMGTEQLMEVVEQHLRKRRYLVVVEDVCARPVWDWIKLIFPDDSNGSWIIVTSQREDLARHCAERPSRSFNLELVSDDDARIYANSDQDAISRGFLEVIEIEPHSEFIGRNDEVKELKSWITMNNPERVALSVHGDTGIGKTTLVRNVYDSTELRSMFKRVAWITMVHPFNKEEFLRDTISQFQASCSLLWKNNNVDRSKTGIKNQSCDDLVTEICVLMKDGRSLLVLDGLSAAEEWDQVKSCLWTEFSTSVNCSVIVTATSASVASYCSGYSPSFMYKMNPLNTADAHLLFYKKVFRHDRLIELSKQMVDHAYLIIQKCHGNPLAINIIGGLLCTKSRTSTEWEKLLNRFDSEFKNNHGLGVARVAARLGYDDLPFHMKYLVQYLSIFPRSYNLGRRRLAKAWLAETYRRNARGDHAEEVEDIFDALVTRSMVHPLKRAQITSGRISGCRIDDVFRQLCFSEAKSGGFIHILDEHTVINMEMEISQIKHLVVTSGWKRDDDQFKKLDLSCARSLTVIGKWSSCFLSPSMNLLRVLDLEDTEDLVEHHDLEHIGEFRHLKYLGLRNTGIALLPKSLGKLHGLEELDIRGTYIAKLPSTVIHLTKLRRLRGGTLAGFNSQPEFVTKMTRDCPELLKNVVPSGFSTCFLSLCQRQKPYSVGVPGKIGELTSLLTMGTINAAGSRTVMKEVKKLTQLQKLGVMGVTKRNSKHLCSTLECLHHMRSLMVHSDDSLSRLDTVSLPLHHLETLKLYGKLGALPRWIKTLHSLRKLCLRATLLDGGAVQIIAKLPKLIVLRLLAKSVAVEEIVFQSEVFPRLELLQLVQLDNLMSLSFESGAVPNLEILQVYNCKLLSDDSLRLFHDLPRIKKVLLDGMPVQQQPSPRFRYTLDLKKEAQKEETRRKIRAQAQVLQAAFRFKEAGRTLRSEKEE